MTDDLLNSAGVVRSDLAAALEERGEFSPIRGAFEASGTRCCKFFMKHNMFVAEFADAALLGLAKEYKDSGLSPKKSSRTRATYLLRSYGARDWSLHRSDAQLRCFR